jgi:hypothetical protein
MTTHATGTYTTKSWDEQSFSEIEGAGKLTRASVVDTFQGDIEGEATLEYLMAYRDDQFASFVGLERVVGRIGDRAGSFALQQRGTFENGVVKATWSVVPDSGTGGLRGLRGEGGYLWDAQQGQSATFTLDYNLA